MEKIIKRDGRQVNFDRSKIEEAILRAFVSVDGDVSEYAEQKAEKIADFIEEAAIETEEPYTVEEIQDMVEKGLMSTKRKDVAKSYILYRQERNRKRNINSKLMQDMRDKLLANNIENQNANVDEHSFGGRKGEADSVIMKNFALDYCMSKKSKENHLNNEIYIHDLDSYAVGMHNCLTIPFDKLLAEGFNTRQTDVRPANSVNTAFQLVAVIFQLQSLQQFGGVSASHLDWTMVPYVRKSFYKHYKDGLWYINKIEYHENEKTFNPADYSIEYYKKINNNEAYQYAMDMTLKETRQAVEGMYHNLNTLQSRSGNQLPFTSINYGTCTLPEGRMVTEALLKGCIKGVGKLHKTSIFPCGIFQYMKGVNDRPGTPNYDLYKLALESTAKRLYPNYANVDWSGNEGYDRNDPQTYFSTMGCRTANGADINADPGVNPQTKDGRGNICPVTIIMPTLAMEAKEKAIKESHVYDILNEAPVIYDSNIVKNFLDLLDDKIHEAKDMLIERFDYICSQSPSSAKFMYENGTMIGYKPEEGIRSALKHGTLAIGQIGLAETLQILIGKDHTTPEGMELAKEIEKLFKDNCADFKKKYRLNFGVYYTPAMELAKEIEKLFKDNCADFKKKYRLNFGVYYTPAENLCKTAMDKFKAKYGVIPHVSDKDFFTNSIHVPVWVKVNPFEKIDIESQLTGYSSAGCITYVELDSSAQQNLDALETIVNYAMDHDIPYFAINVPADTCLECGFQGEVELDKVCPNCGSDHIQRLRRVTGYLTGDYLTAFNKGKIQETEMRVKHIRFNQEE